MSMAMPWPCAETRVVPAMTRQLKVPADGKRNTSNDAGSASSSALTASSARAAPLILLNGSRCFVFFGSQATIA